MEKRKYEFKSIVAETLLIPLYMRTKESRRANPILKDGMAERLISEIDYDYSRFDNSPKSETGCLVRGWYFDRAVRNFIAIHPHPVVVNVGCGLDTRYQRIGSDGRTVFYELDLPEVMDLRRNMIPEAKDDIYISDSLLETGWMDALLVRHPGSDFIFVVEGVLMYFHEDEVKSFLRNIASRFSGGEIWFDVCGTMMTRHGVKPDSLRNHEAQIRSGIDDGRIVQEWIPELEMICQDNYMAFFRNRWQFLFGHVLGRIKRLCFKFSSLLGYRIKGGRGNEEN